MAVVENAPPASAAVQMRGEGAPAVDTSRPGVQSFVSVMSAVWRRPAWTLLEIGWRWTFGIPALLLLQHYGLAIWASAHTGPNRIGAVDLNSLSATAPEYSAARIAEVIALLWPPVWSVARFLLPLLGLAWVLLGTLGRSVVVRHMDRTARIRPWTQLVLAACRLAAFWGVMALWLRTLAWAGGRTVAAMAARGQDPNLLGLAAWSVAATLGMFVAWSLVGWVFTAAPLLSGVEGEGVGASLRRIASLRGARGRLIELNLVMGIVRVALVVLGMVLSACPLPFESVETPAFLLYWNLGVVALFFVASDYFQVVKTAVYRGTLAVYLLRTG